MERRKTEGQEQDWIAVGDYIRQALFEVAAELGGDETFAQIKELASNIGPLPNPAALSYLENNFPGLAEKVISLAEKLQDQRLNLN